MLSAMSEHAQQVNNGDLTSAPVKRECRVYKQYAFVASNRDHAASAAV